VRPFPNVYERISVVRNTVDHIKDVRDIRANNYVKRETKSDVVTNTRFPVFRRQFNVRVILERPYGFCF